MYKVLLVLCDNYITHTKAYTNSQNYFCGNTKRATRKERDKMTTIKGETGKFQ